MRYEKVKTRLVYANHDAGGLDNGIDFLADFNSKVLERFFGDNRRDFFAWCDFNYYFCIYGAQLNRLNNTFQRVSCTDLHLKFSLIQV